MKGGNKPHFYFPSVFTVWVLCKMTKFKKKRGFNPNMIDCVIKRHGTSVE